MEGETNTAQVGEVNNTLAQQDGDVKVVNVEGQEQYEWTLCGKVYTHNCTAESHMTKSTRNQRRKLY